MLHCLREFLRNWKAHRAPRATDSNMINLGYMSVKASRQGQLYDSWRLTRCKRWISTTPYERSTSIPTVLSHGPGSQEQLNNMTTHTNTHTHHFLFFLPYSISPPSHYLPLLIKILLLSYGWFHPKYLEEGNVSTDLTKLRVTDSSPAFVKCKMSLLTQVNSNRWGFGWQREVRGKHNESEQRNLCEVS